MLHRIRSESFSLFSHSHFFLFVSFPHHHPVLLLSLLLLASHFRSLSFVLFILSQTLSTYLLYSEKQCRPRFVENLRRNFERSSAGIFVHCFDPLSLSLFPFFLYVLCLTSYGILHTSKNINRLAHKTEATFRPVARRNIVTYLRKGRSTTYFRNWRNAHGTKG